MNEIGSEIRKYTRNIIDTINNAIIKGNLDDEYVYQFAKFLDSARKGGSPHSEWIHIHLALVEALDGFNDLLPG
jgi:hypothetical protein